MEVVLKPASVMVLQHGSNDDPEKLSFFSEMLLTVSVYNCLFPHSIVLPKVSGLIGLAFSQVLNKVSGDRIGVAEEDDEMDGGALYGDADEIRGAV